MKISSVFGPIIGGAFMLTVSFLLMTLEDAVGLESTIAQSVIGFLTVAALFLGFTSLIVGLVAFKESAFVDEQHDTAVSCVEAPPTAPEIAPETAPRVLAERSGDQELRMAVEAFETSRSAWESMSRDDLGNGSKSRLLHGIRTLREACLKTLNNPELASEAEALKAISKTMARLTAEMDRYRFVRKQGDLVALEQDLIIMERQLFLQPLSATKELV